MKKRLCAFLLILAMLAVSLPAAALDAESKTGFTDTETYLRTSFCDSDFLELTITGRTLHIHGAAVKDGLRMVTAKVGDSRGQAQASSGRPFDMQVSLPSGGGTLSVYLFGSASTGWSYTYNAILIVEENGAFRFAPSLIRENNRVFYNAFLNPADYMERTYDDEVGLLSHDIVGGETDDYRKLFLLHQWVAEHIYYDYDYFYDRSSAVTVRPEDILNTRRSVCEGYANLLRDLIRAQGIPCMKVSTYALGVGESGRTFAETGNENTTVSNHAHVEAYADGRWVIMDPTWDSNNEYRNGEYETGETYGYFYFDVTPEALALDHRIIDRGGAYIDASGKIRLPQSAQTPSNWAKKEVAAAIAEGLVPYSLQKAYAKPIARIDTAQIIVRLLEQSSGMTAAELLAMKGLTADGTFSDTNNEAVRICKALGIIGGVGGGRFDPNGTLTRGQMAAIINRTAKALGVDTAGYTHSFTDVKGHWCSKELGWPVAMGIINGIGGGKFGPEQKLSAEQAIAMAVRTLNALR